MATISQSDRSTTITLASVTAGPFDVGFRIFAGDSLSLYLNGEKVSTGWTLSASYVDGYSDDARVLAPSSLAIGDVLVIDGAQPASRDDYVAGDPGLVSKLNQEFSRLWSAVQDLHREAARSLRGLEPVDPDNGLSAGDIGAAQGYAEDASAAALAAAASAAAAAAAENSLLRWRGAWATGTLYRPNDIVFQAGSSYVTIVQHTSGTFATDLAAGRLTMFAQQGSAGAGTGDMLAAQNLNDLASKPTARSNLGLGALATLSAVGSSQITDGSVTEAKLDAAAQAKLNATSGDITTNDMHGAAGGVRLYMGALERLEAGTQIRARKDGEVISQTVSGFIRMAIGFVQGGTVRISVDLHRDGGNSAFYSQLIIKRVRAGVTTTLTTLQTNQTSYVTLTADISVLPGDALQLVNAISTAGADSYMRNLRVQTNGQDLWPAPSDGIIEGNRVLS